MSKAKILIISFFVCLAILLKQIFNGNIILPQFFSFGFLTIRYYGLFIALAAVAGYFLALKRALKFGIKNAEGENIIFWAVFGGFVGARLYHILSSAGYYINHPFDIFKVWNGGLSIYGVILGGLIALWFYRKFFAFRFSFFTILNWLTPSLILGQIIGRFGNLFNYELFGYATDLPWKMYVPAFFRPEAYANFNFFHPLFLYEQLGNGIILFYLLYREKQGRGGNLFIWYLLLYNILRFVLEFIRIESVFWQGIRINAFVSLLFTVIALILLLTNKQHAKSPGS